MHNKFTRACKWVRAAKVAGNMHGRWSKAKEIKTKLRCSPQYVFFMGLCYGALQMHTITFSGSCFSFCGIFFFYSVATRSVPRSFCTVICLFIAPSHSFTVWPTDCQPDFGFISNLNAFLISQKWLKSRIFRIFVRYWLTHVQYYKRIGFV